MATNVTDCDSDAVVVVALVCVWSHPPVCDMSANNHHLQATHSTLVTCSRIRYFRVLTTNRCIYRTEGTAECDGLNGKSV
jgi:hypothetical protein